MTDSDKLAISEILRDFRREIEEQIVEESGSSLPAPDDQLESVSRQILVAVQSLARECAGIARK